MDTTSTLIIVAMFTMAAVFIGIGIFLARKNSGAAQRRDNQGYGHTDYPGGASNNDSRDNNNDSHASDNSSSSDSGGSDGGSSGGGE